MSVAVAEASSSTGVTVMVFTLNEEIHLPACLDALRWCDDVIVVDSFSTDRTAEIARARGAQFHQRAFDGFGSQRNWALDSIATRHEWVLILDADERATPELALELGRVAREAPKDVAAYRVRRRFHLWNRWLRHSSLYPTWVVRLVRKGRVRYVNRGHAETQQADGIVAELQNDLIDENLKGLDEWFERQNRYSSREAEFELREGAGVATPAALFSPEPLVRRAAMKALARDLPGRALWYFLYAYLVRGGFLEGRDGFMFCAMKAIYQQMIVVKKYDARRRAGRA